MVSLVAIIQSTVADFAKVGQSNTEATECLHCSRKQPAVLRVGERFPDFGIVPLFVKPLAWGSGSW